jgi:hypothetical protein
MHRDISQFLANNAAIKQRVEADRQLCDRIRQIVSSPGWGDSKKYERVVPGEFVLKGKYFGHVELSVTADLYSPGLPMSPFAVLVDKAPNTHSYLVKDLGELAEASIYGWGGALADQAQVLIMSLGIKGYEIDLDNLGGHRIFGMKDGRLYMHDLDGADHFSNIEEIEHGVIWAEGRFQRLAEFLRLIEQPEHRVFLEPSAK